MEMESRWLSDTALLEATSRGGLWLWACLGLFCRRLPLPMHAISQAGWKGLGVPC